MRNLTTAFAAALAVLLLSACAKKEEAPPADSPLVKGSAPVETAPSEPAPVDENSEDAEQSGGDKVKP
jgi:hypothetical protein